MKATGQLRFDRLRDGSVTFKWSGGKRIAISGEMAQEIAGTRAHVGQVLDVRGLMQLRLVDVDIDTANRAFDGFIAMREGRLARTTAWYVQWLHRSALPIFLWECKWLRRRKPIDAEMYPKWSIPGILLHPLL